jgi:hypothetical protein
MLITISSCVSTPREKGTSTIYPISRTYYNVDYPTVWKSAVKTMEGFPIDQTMPSQGLIVTQWKKGGHSEHYESYGRAQIARDGKYKLSIFIRHTNKGINVKVIKEHLVEIDNLTGWRAVKTDAVLEKSILYRIGHLIAVEKYLKEQEDAEIDDLGDPCSDLDNDGYCDEDDCADDDNDGYCDDDEEEDYEPIRKKKKKKKKKRYKKKKRAKSKIYRKREKKKRRNSVF